MNDNDEEVRPRLIGLNPWQGKHIDIWNDATPELLVQGARMSGKTTLLLDKELHWLHKAPGIKSFLFRYSDTATRTLLVPRFEEIARIRGMNDYAWNQRELCYEFTNGSKAFMFGLKAVSASQRYEKLRGQDMGRVFNDQAEETPDDIALELRASLRQAGFPQQLTFSPNPPNEDHWLAKPKRGGFPLDNSVKNRRMYELTIYDNAYNLTRVEIDRMEQSYPPDHPKYRPMILGKRGMNVFGIPVYEGVFDRNIHIRPIAYDPDRLLLEGFDFGQHQIAWVAAQRFYAGGLGFLGGIFGQDLFLEDFLPTVLEHRAKWFPLLQPKGVRTCCPSPGALVPSRGNRYTNVSVLRGAGFMPIYNDHGNSPDVVAAMIERLASYMLRRTATKEEAFGVNNNDQRWWRASREGIEPFPFLAHGFESAYVWDEHMVSVGNNRVRQPKDDDWFAHGMRAAQNIELNFCVDQPSDRDVSDRRTKRFSAMADMSEFTKSALQRIGF